MENEEFKLGFIRQIVNDPEFKQGTTQYKDGIINQMLSIGVPRMTIDRVINESGKQLPPWPQGCVIEDTSKYGNPNDVLEQCQKDDETGEVIDPITFEPIPENKLVRTRCNGQLRCYNIDTLKKALDLKLEDPFTRSPVSREFLNEVNRRIMKTGGVTGLSLEERRERLSQRSRQLGYVLEEIDRYLSTDPNISNELGTRRNQLGNTYRRLLSNINQNNSPLYIQKDEEYVDQLERQIQEIQTSIQAYQAGNQAVAPQPGHRRANIYDLINPGQFSPGTMANLVREFEHRPNSPPVRDIFPPEREEVLDRLGILLRQIDELLNIIAQIPQARRDGGLEFLNAQVTELQDDVDRLANELFEIGPNVDIHDRMRQLENYEIQYEEAFRGLQPYLARADLGRGLPNLNRPMSPPGGGPGIYAM